MLRRDSLTIQRWQLLHDRLDAVVADAAISYLQLLAIRRIPIRPALWSRELDELRMGREPDYAMPGFPLLYALRYMPRRVISVFDHRDADQSVAREGSPRCAAARQARSDSVHTGFRFAGRPAARIEVVVREHERAVSETVDPIDHLGAVDLVSALDLRRSEQAVRDGRVRSRPGHESASRQISDREPAAGSPCPRYCSS